MVGGDFYDVIERGDSLWLVIGDVAGHGLGAARTMGKTRFFVRAMASSTSSPSDLLRSVSQLLVEEQQAEMVTCLAVRHDPRSATISIASAGHPGAIITPESGPSHQVTTTPYPPLGFAPWPSGQRDLVLGAPARLVAFTDGFVERRGEVLDRGVERLVNFVDDHLDVSMSDLAEQILGSDLGNDDDDAAVLCARFVSHPGTTP